MTILIPFVKTFFVIKIEEKIMEKIQAENKIRFSTREKTF